MRRNFEFFGAPVVLFIFVRQELGAYSVLDAGIFLQSLMLSAQARGLGTCAEGALGTWAGPVREAFEVPPAYKLLCGVALGWSSDHVVNTFNPGRADVAEMLIPERRG
jgi:nitroreductase